MANVYDIRYNLLLRSPMSDMKRFYFVDSISYQILNSPSFWMDKYTNDNVPIPEAGDYTFKQYYIYYKAYKYYAAMERNCILMAVIDVTDIAYRDADFYSTENYYLHRILDEMFHGRYSSMVMIFHPVGKGKNIRITTGSYDYSQKYNSYKVNHGQFFKLLQYLLISDVNINIVTTVNEQTEESEKEAATATYIALPSDKVDL